MGIAHKALTEYGATAEYGGANTDAPKCSLWFEVCRQEMCVFCFRTGSLAPLRLLQPQVTQQTLPARHSPNTAYLAERGGVPPIAQ